MVYIASTIVNQEHFNVQNLPMAIGAAPESCTNTEIKYRNTSCNLLSSQFILINPVASFSYHSEFLF